MKYVRVILAPEAADAYQDLMNKASGSKQEEAILNSFLQKVELLKENIHYGQPIAKKLIPAEYKTSYGITNLFRARVPLRDHRKSEIFWELHCKCNSTGSVSVVALPQADEILKTPFLYFAGRWAPANTSPERP
ncbi:hypothetical protein MSMTP_0147 [Methanosarcina sp. MTP4]|uniref:hypothetical protein n=1 Tax=Methanosarcina sp. MTP4 TaxID=1434100 RepID=UPI00061608C9|nr:hypothetical protein [Methanosarcina sp. MTP4]AKB23616.1 hypothetical protein MSMTP_0147 [Methanosarcina sp. MTP4]